MVKKSQNDDRAVHIRKSHHNKYHTGLSGDVLEILLAGGIVVGALTFAPYVLPAAVVFARYGQKKQILPQKMQNTFYYLKQKGYIAVESQKGQTSIALTDKGKALAMRRQLLISLTMQRPKKWDKKWRIVLFDIKTVHRLKRDALRHMLAKVGFVYLQKSAWIYPFDCREAVVELREFFELKESECRLIVSSDIGDVRALRKKFRL